VLPRQRLVSPLAIPLCPVALLTMHNAVNGGLLSDGSTNWIVNLASGIADNASRDRFSPSTDGTPRFLEYKAEPRSHDSVHIARLEKAAIEGSLRRKALLRALDAWYDPARMKIRYEASCTRYFYKLQPLCGLEGSATDILISEPETEGLVAKIVAGLTP